MQLIGVQALGVSVKAKTVNAREQSQDAVAETVLAIQRRAKGHVIRVTGALSRSIQAVMPGQPLVFFNDKTGARQTIGKLGALEGAVTVGMPYAAFVEFGTSRSRAKPYMQPAIAGERNAHRDRVRKELSKA